MMSPGLDIVICLQGQGDAPLLDRALFTTLTQATDLSLAVHVMLPRFSADDLRRLRLSLQALRPLRPAAPVLFHNWQLPDPLFMQAPLLNWSLELTGGRYFVVQNVADLPAPGAYAAMLAALRQGTDALAALPLMPQMVEFWGDVVLPVGSAPTPRAGLEPSLIMLDRARIALRDLVFTAPQGTDHVDVLGALAPHYGIARLPASPALGLRQYPN